MKGTLLFLGTGASAGIPLIGCLCPVCRSQLSWNQRLRSSVLITVEETHILVDAGPDIRQQALASKIMRLDGVILTHAHYDHIGGIDDLRVYNFISKKPLDCLLSIDTYEEIKRRSPYLFVPKEEGKSIPAQFHFHVMQRDFEDLFFQGIPLGTVSYSQGGMKVLGFRVGTLAYISDIREYTREVLEKIRGVEILVVSAISQTPSLMHFTIEEAIFFAEKVGASQVWLTHLSHEIDHEKVSERLPSHVSLAYDGLYIPFEV